MTAASSQHETHILIVEDDRSTRAALKELLEEEGHSVAAAANGEEAQEMALSQPPTLIISDINMPGCDGFTLVARLRERPATQDVPIILMSALDDTDRRVNGLDLGADDFLAKPVDPLELLARVRAHLRQFQRRSELLQGAITDEATGLLNRRGLMQALKYETERANRGSVFSVLLADLDGFKAVNDTHGHSAGDRMLMHVAQALRTEARSVDQVARLGGDEFVVILSNTLDHGARSAAQRFRDRIETEVEVAEGVVLCPQVSLGLATYEPGMDLDALLERADANMYVDKGHRRDSREIFGHTAPTNS